MTGKYSYLVAGLVTLGACGWTAPSRADVRYTITDLGPWRPTAVNDFGVVVGYGPLRSRPEITCTSSGPVADMY